MCRGCLLSELLNTQRYVYVTCQILRQAQCLAQSFSKGNSAGEGNLLLSGLCSFNISVEALSSSVMVFGTDVVR